jgi:hypothetical protein
MHVSGGGDGGDEGGAFEGDRERETGRRVGQTYQTKTNRAREPQILRITLDFGVRKEECHCDESTDDHGAAAAPEVLGPAHVAREDGAGDGAEVGEGVVAPDLAVGEAAELRAAGADVDWEEDVVEGVGEADEELGIISCGL